MTFLVKSESYLLICLVVAIRALSKQNIQNISIRNGNKVIKLKIKGFRYKFIINYKRQIKENSTYFTGFLSYI